MKSKWFFVYAGVGIAFAAVSLWVFLSRGRNAKAIRAKYKLGGALLTAWAMLSAAGCEGPGPFVSCYDPVQPNPNENQEVTCYDVATPFCQIYIQVKGKEGFDARSGDVLVIHISDPDCKQYACKLFYGDDPANLLQEGKLDIPAGSGSEVGLEWTLSTGDYHGVATLKISGLEQDKEGNDIEIYSKFFTLTIQ